MRLSDQVAQKLLSLIQSRGLQPGQRLPAERVLSGELGVSRVSLRAAIQKLSAQGLLVSRAGAGTYLQAHAGMWAQQAVDPLAALMLADPQYRYDVLEARQALESSTAWYAAQRATLADKEQIRRCFDTMVQHQQSRDADKSARADAQFHLAIAQASHNLVLVQVMQSLFDLMLNTVTQNRRSMFVHESPQTLEQLTQQHHALMQAILDGDAQGAREVIGDHLLYVRSRLRQADEDAARQDRARRLVTATASSSLLSVEHSKDPSP